MSDFQADFDKPKSPSKTDGIGAVIFLVLFSLPFAGFGLVALVQGIRKTIAGNRHDGPMLCLFGFIFSLVGFGLMIGGIWGWKKSKETDALKAQYTDKPWMIRPDWAAGRIKSSMINQSKLFLLMGVAFGGIGGFSTYFALPEVWQKHNYPALLVLLFPIAGIAFLIGFARTLLSQRRFGDCFFEPAQIPVPLGGTLDGVIQTGAPLRLEHDLCLRLSCIRRVTTGSGKSRETREYILWQNEKIYSARANLPDIPGGTNIPVHFQLPADQPECSSDSGNSVSWRLDATAKMRGPDFRVLFEIPVFGASGTTAAADEPDPTAAFQAPIDEIRREQHSRIQVNDGPNGREFYFPPARNLGIALFTTVAMLAFNGGAVAMFHFHAPIFFPIVFGIVGLLLVLGTFSAWFRSTRVSIDASGVRLVNHYLFFSRSRQFAASGISRFATRVGMTSGTKVFTDIKLITTDSQSTFAADKARYQQTGQMLPVRFRAFDPSGVTVAGSISSPVEAQWLVQEMNKALGRG